MTRVVSYNILAGGYSLREKGAKRTEQLLKIIRSADPDIVGLPEALNPIKFEGLTVVEEMAQALGMQLIEGGQTGSNRDYRTALMTRLPILSVKNHVRPGVLTRPLLEVCVEERSGQQLTIFVIHLAASFNRRWAGNHIRMREVREILNILAPFRAEGKPHILMGDFNTLAPKDDFTASALLKYVMRLDTRRKNIALQDGHPHLDSVVPRRLRFLNPVFRAVGQSDLLCKLFDLAAYFYAPRGPIRLLKEHYIDCFRYLHPHEQGFTCPAAAPAGRIDYVFADPTLIGRLEMCHVMVEGEDGFLGEHASDHLAMAAEFGLLVAPGVPSTPADNAISRT
ncbi:endonuclease/exonuclease/phosphatase family protein [Dictyobacter aurantiacus]|uniref:Endonuclease/exonuclease/phosphatase domain-containing protein n=1 Tax=Dictyobacter aurantiacus TaxID=1936993 RepID=A0A401ZB41_9CHLR|nr:endonuclease/exonuclease/phosphatase family protein [Dictyobacter aurantiacus]GCE04062.1 hypothetical protein KDAU_13910 [Dictyobacter aurantiacus]